MFLFSCRFIIIGFALLNVDINQICGEKRVHPNSLTDDENEPLILTPYLKENRSADAQALSQILLEDFGNVTHYSGYFTVDENFDSNMFFWFIKSENDYLNDPVILWLQGGPGAPSLYALFDENGPFIVENSTVSFREYSWTKNHSVLYIDNPVGTGYSFTNNGFAQNETKVGEDLYEALVQFFTMFPELTSNDFFIAGESYAGKYVPSIGHAIYRHNSSKINLKGLLIGNGSTDPENQIVEYGNYLYEIGLIDEETKEIFESYQNEIVELIQQKEFLKAFYKFDVLLNGDFTRPTVFQNATGFDTYFNFLSSSSPVDENSYKKYIQTDNVRGHIHVGNTTYGGSGKDVQENLREDMMQSVAPWVSELLSNYRVLFYNGQLDIIVAYRLTVNFLKRLDFDAAIEYQKAKRQIWHVDDEIAGYVKNAGNLTEVLVRNAGHIVPKDQPKWAYDLVYKFVRNIQLSQ